ncbi:MAG: efflux transporter outer membrane subunit [Rhabdochlamydiaceae bacterium]|nr:efflux transporter outer membrane subunit [Rhabdochlamydiaceae bacterium]
MFSAFYKKASIACLLTLSGCVSMSKAEKQEHVAASPSLTKSQKQGLESGVLTEGNWPDSDWWNSFETPVLSDWMEKALAQNPTILSLQSWVEQARQAALVTKSKLFPTLYFNAGDSYRYFSEHELMHLLNPTLPLHGFEVDLLFAFNYEFDFWSKNRNRFRAAIGEWKAREAEKKQVELTVTTSLAQAYFALVTALEKQKLYEKLYSVRKQRLQLQNDMKEGALFSAFEPLLGDEQLQEVAQYLASMEDEIQLQSHLINILVGQGPDVDISLEVLPQDPPKTLPLPQNLSIELLSRRPDLMMQIWRADSLAHEVGVAKAEFFPDINLMAFTGVKSVAWNTLLQNASKSAGLHPTLSLPMYTAGAIRANIRAKKASFDQAIYEYNNLILTSAQEVADVVSKLQMAYAQKKQQIQRVQDRLKRWNLTALRCEGGLDSQFAFLDYEEKWIESKLEETDFTYHQYTFAVQLIKSLGGGYISPVLPIAREDS